MSDVSDELTISDWAWYRTKERRIRHCVGCCVKHFSNVWCTNLCPCPFLCPFSCSCNTNMSMNMNKDGNGCGHYKILTPDSGKKVYSDIWQTCRTLPSLVQCSVRHSVHTLPLPLPMGKIINSSFSSSSQPRGRWFFLSFPNSDSHVKLAVSPACKAAKQPLFVHEIPYAHGSSLALFQPEGLPLNSILTK